MIIIRNGAFCFTEQPAILITDLMRTLTRVTFRLGYRAHIDCSLGILITINISLALAPRYRNKPSSNKMSI